VLGLVGENGSGKSTTMNILGGVHQPEGGRMTLAGEPYAPRNPRDAEAAGIAFIHQELNLFKNLSVEENLFIGGFPKLVRGLPFIDRRKVRARAREMLAAVDLDVAPGTPLSRLSQGERQLVEIAKALGADARIVIFDEPTTSLTARESRRLFELIGRLRARGIAVVYISHILGDVMALCDSVTVLRDGRVVGQAPVGGMSVDRLITLMVGRTIDQIYPPRETVPGTGTPVLEVEGLTQPGIIRDVAFAVRPGEVLGVSGLMGSGRSETARILFGLDPTLRDDPRRRAAARAPDAAGRDGARHRVPHRGPAARGPAHGRADRRQHGAPVAARLQRPLRPADRAARGWASGSTRWAARSRSTRATSPARWPRTCRAATSRRS
jgi:ribose transport system ATP-binding protein